MSNLQVTNKPFTSHCSPPALNNCSHFCQRVNKIHHVSITPTAGVHWVCVSVPWNIWMLKLGDHAHTHALWQKQYKLTRSRWLAHTSIPSFSVLHFPLWQDPQTPVVSLNVIYRLWHWVWAENCRPMLCLHSSDMQTLQNHHKFFGNSRKNAVKYKNQSVNIFCSDAWIRWISFLFLFSHMLFDFSLQITSNHCIAPAHIEYMTQ